MSTYKIPDFGLTANVWSLWAIPTGAPRLVTSCNLAFGRNTRAISQGFSQPEPLTALTLLLVPKGTDLRDYANTGTTGDTVEVPAGSGRYYRVCGVDDVAKGYPNEFRFAQIFKAFDDGAFYPGYHWPTPIP